MIQTAEYNAVVVSKIHFLGGGGVLNPRWWWSPRVIGTRKVVTRIVRTTRSSRYRGWSGGGCPFCDWRRALHPKKIMDGVTKATLQLGTHTHTHTHTTNTLICTTSSGSNATATRDDSKTDSLSIVATTIWKHACGRACG